MLTVQDLAVSFQRSEKGEQIVTDVVRDVDFVLHAGETVALSYTLDAVHLFDTVSTKTLRAT